MGGDDDEEWREEGRYATAKAANDLGEVLELSEESDGNGAEGRGGEGQGRSEVDVQGDEGGGGGDGG